MPDFQSTSRFSDRVENYVRYRPGYPQAMVSALVSEANLPSPAEVADIGAGTGISTELFLARGDTVYAVEPNAPMRAAAEERHSCNRRFHSIAGTAESTGLASASVDLVVAGQAFHWFDPVAARAEFARILRPGGTVALFWNCRQVDSTPFLREYEELLRRFSTDYAQVNHLNIDDSALEAFFGGSEWKKLRFPNSQSFDFTGLQGRLLSSSYAPGPTHPNFEPMLEQLRILFDCHAKQGQVEFLYDTELSSGRLPT